MDLWLTIIFTIVVTFRDFIFAVMFWVNTPFLKSLSFSLLMINLIQYFSVQNAKVSKYVTQALYLIFVILQFLLPYYYQEFQLEWYEWLMLIPYIAVAFLGILIKYTEFGRKWLNYYMMCLYYGAISIITCIFFPAMGVWWGCLIFTIISIIWSNVGALYSVESE